MGTAPTRLCPTYRFCNSLVWRMQYRRARIEGGCYFFTVVTHQRQPLLTLPENITRLRETFRRERSRHPFEIEAIVILPDHLHALWRLPQGDSDYSGRWNRIKRYFSIGCLGVEGPASASRLRKRERPVWQRRFWEHVIRDETDWRRHMDYIHYNPVKHGYCEAVKAWPYSSFMHWVRKGGYPVDWGRTPPSDIDHIAAE